jgi:putative spermidine/putrescine transport system permease protein
MKGNSVLLAAPALFVGAALGVPLVAILISSFAAHDAGGLTFFNYERILFEPYHWVVLWTTMRISLFTTLTSLLLGYPLAYFLIRIVPYDRVKRLCLILVILPLFTSNIIRSFAWMVILGRVGIVNTALVDSSVLERPFRFLGSELGIIIGLTHILLPIVVLNIANALSKVDPVLEQASSDLGAGPLTTFRLVTFPQTLPSVIFGAVTVFALAISAYVTPALLSGGKISVFPMLIFQQYSSVLDFHYGGALGIVLLVVTVGLITLATAAAKPGEKN